MGIMLYYMNHHNRELCPYERKKRYTVNILNKNDIPGQLYLHPLPSVGGAVQYCHFHTCWHALALSNHPVKREKKKVVTYLVLEKLQ